MTGGRAPKRLGDRKELEVARYLTGAGIRCDRIGLAGRQNDQGDLVLLDTPFWNHYVLEVKAHQRLQLGVWLTAARHKAGPKRTPVVVIPRRGRPIMEAYAVTDLRGLAHLISPLL